MNIYRSGALSVIALGFLLACSATGAPQAAEPSESLPQVYITDAQRLADTRARAQAGDKDLKPAIAALVRLADNAMDLPMRSVADKPTVPPSGNKNDYVSLSPYWWPNPDTDDGLPYVRRDGEINPERDLYDVNKLGDFGKAVSWLGAAYYFTGEERYAEEAVKRIKHFLIDPKTRMTPRMLYGQFVPGVNEGRKYGIIETLRLRWVPDAIGMLEGSDAMTDEVMAGAKKWFGDYARWLNTSEFGVGERDGPNNHGTWCTAQIAYFAAFAGDWDTVKDMCKLVPARIGYQIEPDGRQPEELERTKALDYSEFNIRALTELAVLGERVGVDLWSYQTDDGRSLRKALDFVVPYMAGEKDWPYKQISAPQKKHDWYVQTLRRAAIAYDDPRYEQAIRKLDGLDDAGIVFRDLLISRPKP